MLVFSDELLGDCIVVPQYSVNLKKDVYCFQVQHGRGLSLYECTESQLNCSNCKY